MDMQTVEKATAAEATAPFKFTDTRSVDQFIAGQNALTELAMSGQLTPELLNEAMKAMYDDGADIDRSIGFTWICKNPDLFGRTAETLELKARDFLLEHISLSYVGYLILLHPKVLMLIAQDEREAFVQEIYCRYGAFNNSWTGSVLKVGVSQSTVAALILEKLEAVPDNCDSSCNDNAVRSFLESGDSQHDKESPAPWQVLTDEQFELAIGICSRKSPRWYFDNREHIEKRLAKGGKSIFTKLGRVSVLRVTELTHPQQKFVDEQEIDFRVTVARNLAAGPASLIPLLLELSPEKGAELFADRAALFEDREMAWLYRSTWASRHKDGKPRAPWLERELDRRLSESGHIIGTVQLGTYTPRGGKPQPQWQVCHGGTTYVMERRQRGPYRPEAGDQVIINPRSAQQLTPLVKAVYFLPAHSGEKTSY
jgi:hypothetical protein